MRRICIFGDSIARGVVLDEARKKYTFLKDSFVSLTQERCGAAIKNFARFGATVAKGQAMMEKNLSCLSSYDWTVLEFGGNDCDFIWKEVACAPHAQHSPQTTMGEFTARYEKMISFVEGSGSRPLPMTLPPLDPERFLRWISRGLDRSGILDFLNNDTDTIYQWHRLYSDAVMRLAKKRGLPVIDVRKVFIAQGDYRGFLCGDGMHPNREGHRLIAMSFSETLQQVAYDLSRHDETRSSRNIAYAAR